MPQEKSRIRRGLTLIEIMSAVLIVGVAVVGASAYRYYSMMDARKAEVNITAARIGWTLLEGWRDVGGSSLYSPAAEFGSQMDIFTGTGPGAAAGFNRLSSDYEVATPDAHYYITFAYKNAGNNRQLNVCVAWAQGFQEGDISRNIRAVSLSTYVTDPNYFL
ncbi:MAG: prepilin-type N-terminal cleavage/methylation domain-containing protein [Planctomycetota bacterium]